MYWTIELVYNDYFVPYTRTVAGVRRRQSQRYMTSKEVMGWKLKEQMRNKNLSLIASDLRLAVHCIVGRTDKLSKRDLDNSVKAIFDAANGIVWEDDRQVDTIIATRRPYTRNFARVRINPLYTEDYLETMSEREIALRFMEFLRSEADYYALMSEASRME